MTNFNLNFHSIYSDTEKFHDDPIYSYHLNDLEILFYKISTNNIQVKLTFDDGHLSDLKLVVPLLKKYKLTAIFFVIGSELKNNQEKWEQTKKISDLGYVIGSHSFNHVDLTKLNEEQLVYELKESKKIIESCIQKEIVDFSFPYGKYNKKVIDSVLKAGYSISYTTNGHSLSQSRNKVHRFNVKSHHSVRFINSLITNSGFESKVWRLILLTKNILKLRW